MKCSYIEELAKLSATGKPFVSVNVIETVGSVPQKSRNKMLVTADGLVYGTVGGGKVEHKAIQEAQQMLAPESSTNDCLLEWNLQNDVGMTCGGVVKLYFEVYNRNDWHIVVFGAGHVSQALVRLLLTLDCRVSCLDSRSQWLDRIEDDPRLTKICTEDLTAFAAALTDDDYVICMTMGHSTDRPVLSSIFKNGIEPAYLGVIGSKSKRGALIRELKAEGIDAAAAEKFLCPMGLSIGSNQPAEIAISIAAQLLEFRDANVEKIVG